MASVEGGLTRRITNTPWQERSVSFSPDGRSLIYAVEKDDSWDIQQISLAREEELYFYASTTLKEEVVIATDKEEFQPEYSPDGKEVAYLEDRVTLKVIDLESKATRTIMPAKYNYSYADGDQWFQWSPDGKWFLVRYQPSDRMFVPEVGLAPADGEGEITNLTLSGYGDYSPKWAMDGKMMTWGTARRGALAQGNYPVTYDVYGMFFSKEAFDRFKLSKEELALLKEVEKKEKEAEKEDGDEEEDKKKKDKKGKDAKEDEEDN